MERLWFHLDCDSGASYWDSCRCKQDLIDMGFKKVKPQDEVFQPKYRARGGEILAFDISKTACYPFGFLHNDRVRTPKGLGTG